MSEPVQNNQSAPAGTDPAVAASDAVAQADAIVSDADLSAALAEVDKMDSATPTGDVAAESSSSDVTAGDMASEQVHNSTSDEDAVTEVSSSEPTPSQDQLDDIASQVEATVFGDGQATELTPPPSPDVQVTSDVVSSPSAVSTQPSYVPAIPPVVSRPVTPAPAATSFFPAPVPAAAPAQSTPALVNSPVNAVQLQQPNQGIQPTNNFTQPPSYATVPNINYGTMMAPSLAQPQMGYQNTNMSTGMAMQPNAGQQNGGFGAQQPGFMGNQPQQFSPQNGGMQPQMGYTNGQFGMQQVSQMQQMQQMQMAGAQPQGNNQQGGVGQMSAPGQQPQMGYQNTNMSTGMAMQPNAGQQNGGFGAQQPGFMGNQPQQFSPQNGGMQPQVVQPPQPAAPLVQALPPGTVISGPGGAGAQPALSPSNQAPASTAPPTASPVVDAATQSAATPASAPASAPTPTPAPASAASPANSTSQKTYASLIDVIGEQNLLTPDKLNQLKQEFLTSGRNYEDLLAEKKWLSEESLTRAKAKLNNLPYITIGETGISPEALSKLDESVARRYGILPFGIDKVERKLLVAMKNPLDIQAIGFVEQKTGLTLAIHYASPSEIERVIVERYAQNLSSEVNEALKDTDQSKVRHKEQNEQINNFGGVIRDAPINRIVETILEFAVKSRASDIHIEPLPNKVRVRYRIDGILVEKLILPRSVIDAVVSRIKILGNMKIDEKRIPQDGRFNYTNDVKNVDLRVSTIPTVHGEKINMRLLEKNLSVPTMEQLGLDGLSLSHVREAIKVPHGIILISGPTGSGKTTTLYSLINILNTPKVNIVTLEDPVEYQMLGVNQVQINPKAGLTFATGLRAFLRQDPNIIMVGEMRDSETTGLAIQASLTGHLVFSTIHTSSAATALPRMTDMGAENFLIASSVTLIMAQRVVRKINPAYLEEYVPEPAVVADIAKVLGPHFDSWLQQHGKTPQTLTLFRPSANRPENEPEYLGRIAIYEVLRMTEVIGRMVLQNRPASEIEQEALRNGMLLMKQDGYVKALNGITTIEEVLRVADV